MVICDHEFFGTNYLLSPEYNPNKVLPYLKIECCKNCGILKISHDDVNDIYQEYLNY